MSTLALPTDFHLPHPSAADIKTKYGVVILLDALGQRSASIEDARKYLTALDNIRRGLDVYTQAAAQAFQRATNAQARLSRSKSRYFGDTILITCEISQDSDEEKHALHNFGFILGSLLKLSLIEKTLFRGAVAIGEYIETADAVLGPAIVDAANWYEKGELMGIYLTPQTYAKTQKFKGPRLPSRNNRWLKYDIPTKVGPIPTLAINWVDDYYRDLQTDEDANIEFYSTFSTFFQPFGTELKYRNTEVFFHAGLAHLNKLTPREKIPATRGSKKPSK